MSNNPLNSDSQPDSLDHVLDLALASYTPVEPRLGLEDRVRTRLTAASSAPQGRARLPLQWIWSTAGAFAAAALLLVMLRTHTRPTPPTPKNLATVQAGPSVPPVLASERVPTAALRGASKKKSSPNPTPRPRFTPVPIPRQPSQQQLIAQLVANGSEAIAALVRADDKLAHDDKLDKPISIQPLPDDPLVIEPIKVTPIDDNPAEPGGKL